LSRLAQAIEQTISDNAAADEIGLIINSVMRMGGPQCADILNLANGAAAHNPAMIAF